MENVQEFLKNTWIAIQKLPENNWFVGVVGSLIAALLVYLFSRFVKLGPIFFAARRDGQRVKTGVEHYRIALEEKTFRISHPWMKEEQTLSDILVPVNFGVDGGTERAELESYLRRAFQETDSPRILILGKPGSGKSIAMRVIARAIWTIDAPRPPVPILMTFTDVKGIATRERLEAKLVETLEYYQFEEGRQDSQAAERFVAENLYEGNILLLFDGYDELDKATRKETAMFLNWFLGAYPKIPAVISSRVAVYERELAFDNLVSQRIEMAPFTRFAIRKFLSQWRFEEGKSAHALFDLINGKAHLADLASNPLMLTIITFLYALPKYTLPDNRVEFYELCTRALLEEWDRAQRRDRANRFESHQKIAILSRIAFEHITKAKETDELIPETRIHDFTKEEMQRLSLKVDEYPKMSDEIVLNSGLLQQIPPTDYRFPHRTFMEFFAANYLNTQKRRQDVLDLYTADAEKWKQTLLLYMGLNKNQADADAILHRLKSDFVESWQNSEPPKTLVFSALTECAVPDPTIATEILELASQFLSQREPLPEIIEELSYIAANPRWAYAQKAKDILLGLLNRKLDDQIFQRVLFALLHAKDERIDPLIMDNLRRINLAEFFARLTARESYFVHRLLSIELSEKEKGDIVEGVKEAGNFDILGTLLIESRDRTIRELSAYALFRMSKLEGFFAFLDNAPLGLLEDETLKAIDEKFAEWGWTWGFPKTENGKKTVTLICDFTANWIVAHRAEFEKADWKQINNWLRYLTTGFLVEKGIKFHELNLIGFNKGTASKQGLKGYWQRRVNLDNLWYKLWKWKDQIVLLLAATVLYLLISLIGISGFLCQIFGWTSNNFYVYLFDDFTANFLCFQFIGIYVIIFCWICIVHGYQHELWLGGILGPSFLWFLAVGADWSRFMIKCVSFLFFGLAVGVYLLPLHRVWFNILLSLQFMILGAAVFDIAQLNFALIHTQNLEMVYRFLEQPRKQVPPR